MNEWCRKYEKYCRREGRLIWKNHVVGKIRPSAMLVRHESELHSLRLGSCNFLALLGEGGRQTEVPGIRGSQTTLGLASLNLSSVHPCCRDTSQQVSPGCIQCTEVPSGHFLDGAVERPGDRRRRQTSSKMTAIMRKKGKSVRYEF